MSLRRLTFLLLPLILCVTGAMAQVNTYGFSSSTGNAYVRLTNPNMLPPVNGDTALRLPFTFTLDSARTDTLWLSQNGFGAFKKTGFTSSSSYPMTGNLNYLWMMAPFGRQLTRIGGSNPSTLKIDTVGSTPNRIFKAEWSNFRVNGATGAHTMSFQLWLYETSNKIEFWYGTFTNPTSNESIHVGLRGLNTDIAAGQITTRRASNTWANTIPSTSLNGLSITYSSTLKPDSGLIYVWTMPPACNTVTNIGTLPDTVYTCFNTPATIFRSSAPVVSGLYYQWQSSPDKNTWTDVINTTGNYATYTTDTVRTPMWYRLKATCVANSQTYYTTNAVRVKSYPAIDVPYHEDFEGTISSLTQLPECMYSTSNVWRTTTDAFTGARAGYFYVSSSGSQVKSTMMTPGVNLNAGTTYRMSFWYTGYLFNNTDTLFVLKGTFPHRDSMDLLAPGTMIIPNTGGYYRYAYFDFTVPTTGVYHMGIEGRSNDYAYDNIDDIDIRPSPATDVTIDSLHSPNVYVPQCYTANTDISMRIRNAGTGPVSNVTAYYKVNGVEYGPEIVPGPIAAGASTVYTFTQKANLSGNRAPYFLSGRVVYAGDNITSNDSTDPYLFYTDSIATVPYVENFNGSSIGSYLTLRWYENEERSIEHASLYTFSSRNNTSDFLTFDFSRMENGIHRLWTPLIGPVTDRSFLRFDYRLNNYFGTSKISLQNGDTIFVLASADCGASYDTLMALHNGNQADTSKFTTIAPLSLAKYAGSRVRLAYRIKITSAAPHGNLYFDVDNFRVTEINPKDMAVTALFDVSTIACLNTGIPVKVALKNEGGLPATGFDVAADFGATTGVINHTYTGRLEYLQADTLVIGTFTPTVPGIYTFKVYTKLTGDTSYGNDTQKINIYVPTIPATATALMGDTVCEGTSATVTGMQDDTLTLVWYAGPTGGNPVFRGSPFVTPKLTTGTTYYAEQVSRQVGRAGNKEYNPMSGTGFTSFRWGLILDVASDSKIDSFAVYPTGTGSITVKISSCGNCSSPVTIDSVVYNFTNATGNKTMLALGTFLPKGNGYFFSLDSYNGVSLKRDFPFTNYPYRGNSPVVVRSGFGNNQAQYDGYYYFYDFAITAFGCGNGTRTPVAVSVDPLPVADFSIGQVSGVATFTNNSKFAKSYVWTFGDGNGSTATSPTNTYTQNGTYDVTLIATNDCGSDTQLRRPYINTVSVKDINAEHGISVYPNPASDKLLVNISDGRLGDIYAGVYAINGQKVKEYLFEGTTGEQTFMLDVSGLTEGNYVLKLQYGTHAKTTRFTIKRP